MSGKELGVAWACMCWHADAGVWMCWHEMQMVADADGGGRGWWWMQMVVDADGGGRGWWTRMVNVGVRVCWHADADGGGCG